MDKLTSGKTIFTNDFLAFKEHLGNDKRSPTKYDQNLLSKHRSIKKTDLSTPMTPKPDLTPDCNPFQNYPINENSAELIFP